MGSPKALLPFQGSNFLDSLIELYAGWCSTVVVVLGFDEMLIREGCHQLDRALVVQNPDPGRGMLTSLQCGLAAVPSHAREVYFQPVDAPGIQLETLAALSRETGESPIAVPSQGERHGHPVLIASVIAAEILALPAEASARDVLHRHRDKTVFVQVSDPAVLLDIDDRQAFQELGA